MAATALYCGGLNIILLLLYANEISDFYVSHLQPTGLAKLYYFPFCLSYFYNLLLLAAAGVVAITITFFFPPRRRDDPQKMNRPFALDLLLPLVFAAVLQGEYESFGLQIKTMRSLLLLLPPMWLLILWLAERARVQMRTVILLLSMYSFCIFAQVLFGPFSVKYRNPDGYQLTDDWYRRLPSSNVNSVGTADTTRLVLDQMLGVFPQGGKIVVGSDRLYLNNYSLNWFAERDLLLQGEKSDYDFARYITPSGFVLRDSLKGANGILVFIGDDVQYSESVTRESWATVEYAQKQWEPAHMAKVIPIQSKPLNGSEAVDFAYLIVLRSPLSSTQMEALAQAIHAPGLIDTPISIPSQLFAKPLSLNECFGIITKWWQHKQEHLPAIDSSERTKAN